MASIRTFILFLSILVQMSHCGFVTVQCKTENVGVYGQQVMVDCVIQLKPEAADAEIRMVIWKKQKSDQTLLYFNRGEYEVLRTGYSFAEPSWNNKNRNVSLLIDKAAVEDQGVYTCTVLTDRGHDNKDTHLEIRAKYSKPTVKSTPDKITENTGGVLTCTSEGGYPQGRLRWFDSDGAEWTNSAKMEAVKTKDGLFRLSSNLTLLRRSTFSKYTCTVFNSTGGKEEEFLFEINVTGKQGQDPETSSASRIVAPVVVIGSLIVGLLLILLVVRLRRTRRELAPTCELHAAMDIYQEPDVEKRGSKP